MSIEKLVQRNGAYSLPFLIEIKNHDETEGIRLANDVRNIEFENQVYLASTFTFSPADTVLGFDGGGQLSITVIDNNLIELIERNANLKINVVGVILDDDVTPIQSFRSFYCTVKWDGVRAEFDFEADDRLNMTFPALIFNHYNNRGNM